MSFALDEVRELHLEPTERCNAHCPMCGRNDRGGALNPHLSNREISLDDFRSFFPSSFLRQITSLRLCGNFGDPAAAKELREILTYAREQNPALVLKMNSNGGLRPAEWWFRLGRLFREKYDAVQFGIDGLSGTHEMYRRGTRFETVLANAEAFIRGGGNAHWVFLVFEHNEHQIHEAETIARKLGFNQFTVKATKRFLSATSLAISPEVEVQDDSGTKLYQLKLPKDPMLRNPLVREHSLRRGEQNIGALMDASTIRCRAAERRSLYVSAEGLVVPCCWVGSGLFPMRASPQSEQHHALIASSGGPERLSLRHHSLSELALAEFFELLAERWSRPNVRSGKPQLCARICGDRVEAFEKQFVRETQFAADSSRVSEFC